MNTQARIDWSALALPELFERLARADAEELVVRALAEDLGFAGVMTQLGDITSLSTLSPDARGRAQIASRGDGVIAGLRVAEIVARHAGLSLAVHVDDGARVVRGTRVATLEGPLIALLSHERTMLNFLTFLSGNATLTAQFVDAVRGTRAAICDTRKTVPGLRTLQKYATRCGGASPPLHAGPPDPPTPSTTAYTGGCCIRETTHTAAAYTESAHTERNHQPLGSPITRNRCVRVQLGFPVVVLLLLPELVDVPLAPIL